ncbi:MAG: DegQ family serine endoprotease [Methylacidiphilales bacterium]|nr:DegQ family serine endoprotease [Candidatus Methylacidiphilales bacterium]
MNPVASCRLILPIIAFALIWTCPARADNPDWWPFGKKEEKKTAEIVVNQAPLSRDTKLTTSFSTIVKQVAPSVVTIKTSKTVKLSAQSIPPMMEPFLRRFFGAPDDEDSNGPQQPVPRQKQQGLGSGVIISKDGYILTNNHVVEGVDEILVDLPIAKDGEYKATVIGTDPKTDLAILKIDAKDLPAATLGDSSKLEVGDIVLAIGNPFGIGQTVTMGIVSALGRKISDRMAMDENSERRDLYEDFIQTDAAINRGNSGGALIDAEGRVVGINAAIISPSGGNLGIGFAIPINMARFVMEQIIKNGKVSRGYLGIEIQELTPDLAETYGLKSSAGALVAGVNPGTGADKAGLKKDDIITELNGKAVDDAAGLRLMVAPLPPGSIVKIKYLRDGKEYNVDVKLSELPDKLSALNDTGSETPPDATSGALVPGVTIQNLTTEFRQQLNAPKDVKGVVVTNIDPNSSASEGGLRRGAIISEINGKPVANVKEALDAAKQVKTKVLRLYVWEGGNYHYVPLRKSE